MNVRQPARRHDQAAIRDRRECRERALDLAGVAHIDRAQLHPERWRRGLDYGELTDPFGYGGIAKDRGARHAGRDLFKQLQPFRADAVLNWVKPVALPPGRARLATKPAPTGSGVCVNTIGTVRVAWSNGAMTWPPEARMTSGASATNSAACLRMRSATPAVLR